jgi:hypothetical protein
MPTQRLILLISSVSLMPLASWLAFRQQFPNNARLEVSLPWAEGQPSRVDTETEKSAGSFQQTPRD